MERTSTIICILFTLFFQSCTGDNTIILGFMGPLTGNYADVGVQGRNGAQLAIEDYNKTAKGVTLRMISADVASHPQGAPGALQELRNQGASIIVGPMLSSNAIETAPLLKDYNLLMVSPTSSTTILSKKRDLFFRTVTDIHRPPLAVAEYLYLNENVQRTATLYDLDNEAYTKVFAHNFSQRFKALGGETVLEIPFSSRENPDWDIIIQQLIEQEIEKVFVITSARDLAQFAQYAYLNEAPFGIFSSTWAYSKDILEMGGQIVEGIEFIAFYSDDISLPDFQSFKVRYFQRFGRIANFASSFGYEAVQTIHQALDVNNGKVTDLHETIPGMTVPGIMGEFTFDSYGDVHRTHYIVTIKEGEFITLRTIN